MRKFRRDSSSPTAKAPKKMANETNPLPLIQKITNLVSFVDDEKDGHMGKEGYLRVPGNSDAVAELYDRYIIQDENTEIFKSGVDANVAVSLLKKLINDYSATFNDTLLDLCQLGLFCQNDGVKKYDKEKDAVATIRDHLERLISAPSRFELGLQKAILIAKLLRFMCNVANAQSKSFYLSARGNFLKRKDVVVSFLAISMPQPPQTDSSSGADFFDDSQLVQLELAKLIPDILVKCIEPEFIDGIEECFKSQVELQARFKAGRALSSVKLKLDSLQLGHTELGGMLNGLHRLSADDAAPLLQHLAIVEEEWRAMLTMVQDKIHERRGSMRDSLVYHATKKPSFSAAKRKESKDDAHTPLPISTEFVNHIALPGDGKGKKPPPLPVSVLKKQVQNGMGARAGHPASPPSLPTTPGTSTPSPSAPANASNVSVTSNGSAMFSPPPSRRKLSEQQRALQQELAGQMQKRLSSTF